MGNTSLFKHMIRQPEIVSWVSRNTQSTSMIFSLWTQHRSNGRSISLILLVNCFFQWESYPCLIIDCWYVYTEWYHKEQTDGQLHLTDHFSILPMNDNGEKHFTRQSQKMVDQFTVNILHNTFYHLQTVTWNDPYLPQKLSVLEMWQLNLISWTI